MLIKSCFFKDMLIDLKNTFLSNLMEMIIDYVNDKDENHSIYYGEINPRIYRKKQISLDGNILAFPFRSDYDDTISDITNKNIKLPKNFLKYIVRGLGSMENYDYYSKYRLLSKLLFITEPFDKKI